METSDWIAFSAFGVSLLALMISLYELLSNKPKLRLKLRSATASKDFPGIKFTTKPRKLRPDELGSDPIEMVAVVIANYGRQPTSIEAIQFQMAHSGDAISPTPASPGDDRGSTLPAKISPGEFLTFYFDASVGVVYQPGAAPIALKDFVFMRDIQASVLHAWYPKPQVFRRIHSK